MWNLRTPLVAIFALIALALSTSAVARPRASKLDAELTRRQNASGISSVIITIAPGAKLPLALKKYARRSLGIINGEVLELPNGLLRQLEALPEIVRVHDNRGISGHNYRTSITTGSRAARAAFGVTGAGIGVAVIDSGITAWHDDLTSGDGTFYPYGDQRVNAFVDFVNGRLFPYDDLGHGTHVAGIIAGNGYDSDGRQAGLAPEATLVSLKVLDSAGRGTIANAIAALEWVLANHTQYNIRVVNLSVGAAVRESYWTDPLTLAAKRVADAGVVVVTAAGNRGSNPLGEAVYGGITAPGNAPWVLTVGASSSNGTLTRADDSMATFSSRGPTYFDWGAKPDLVAPGHGTISLSDPTSAFYASKSQYLIAGTLSELTQPYLVLSGTSMAAPVVTGTVALMLQANPWLTPNAVKAILQYTAEERDGYNALTQGAGFLNTIGAVRLARFFATAQSGAAYPLQKGWSKKIIWGSHRLSGGVLDPNANAFAHSTTWGAPHASDGANIIWGTTCADGCDNTTWGTDGGDNIIWGTDGDDNIIWGTTGTDANIIWGTSGLDENIIWGTDCGGADCDNIIWGTDGEGDNIIWGTAGDDDDIIRGTAGDDNIIWGTDGEENIIWGTDDQGNIIWGTDDGDNIIWGTVTGDDPQATASGYRSWLWESYYSLYALFLEYFTDAEFYQLIDGLGSI